jgi:hypothetical protein
MTPLMPILATRGDITNIPALNVVLGEVESQSSVYYRVPARTGVIYRKLPPME